ncbi:MAG: hypothetical protein IJI67_06005 [Clostridia bacterium]|nr:hypothetical protein [Clostridia bacterium]
MKIKKYFVDILTAVVISIFPLLLSEVITCCFSNSLSEKNRIWVIVISYAICALIVYFINLFLPKIKLFRRYRKFEGIWIEFIPEFPRKITICKIYYHNGEYHFDGRNFRDKNEVVGFKSVVMAGKDDKLFYVTDTTKAVDYEGFGKMKFEPMVRNSIILGTGYFIDVKSNIPASVIETEMVKIDKCFCETYLRGITYKKLKTMSYADIYELVKNSQYTKEKLKEKVKE